MSTPNWIKFEMTLNDYQNKASETAVYPGQKFIKGLEYCLFGFAGEAGETLNKYKKILRNEDNPYKHREILLDEIGDTMWYAALVLKELGYTLEDAAQFNLNKLATRKATNELKDHK